MWYLLYNNMSSKSRSYRRANGMQREMIRGAFGKVGKYQRSPYSKRVKVLANQVVEDLSQLPTKRLVWLAVVDLIHSPERGNHQNAISAQHKRRLKGKIKPGYKSPSEQTHLSKANYEAR